MLFGRLNAGSVLEELIEEGDEVPQVPLIDALTES